MSKYKLRLLSDAIEVTTKGIEFTSKTGHLAILQILYAIRARTYSFLEDPIAAQADLKEIEKLLPDRKRIKIYYSDYLLTKGVLLIEELRRNPKDKNLQKHLLKTCKNAIKHSRTVAHIFIESRWYY